MGWFSKRSSTLIPGEFLAQLGRFGNVSWEARVSARPISDPNFGWDNFFSRVFPALRSNETQAIEEISSAAGADDFARFGAFQLIAEFEPATQDPRYVEMMDAALQMMHDRRLSSGHLTRYEADRWIATHGDLRTSFDRIVEVAPPPSDHSANVDLAPGGALLVARMGPGDLDNQFWIERVDENSYGAFSMRLWTSDADSLTRCSEDTIGVWETLDGVLRSLGGYLRSRPFWAHEQLEPYFTERREP